MSEIVPGLQPQAALRLQGLRLATASIGALGFTVWAHHMFTTGAVYLPFFSFFTFLIAVPTGIKFFNWLATMWGGQLKFDTPLLFALGFIAAVPDRRPGRRVPGGGALRLQVQDTYWVVSHLHYVLVAGAVFAHLRRRSTTGSPR